MDKLQMYFTERFPSLSFNEDNIVNVYSSFEEELNTLKYGVGIYNRSHNIILKLDGKDVVNLLERISTNDISTLENFHYTNVLFLNEKSGLIDRATLVKFDDEFYLLGSYDKLFRLQRWIERYILDEDIQIENVTGDFFVAEVLGPQAESYLTLICGEEIDKLSDNKLNRIETENAGFFLLSKETLTGERIYWLISEKGNGAAIIDLMLTNTSVFNVNMIGEKALDAYRIKNVIPVFPNEINDKYNPYEAGLMKEVSNTKENFIGHELIHKLRITNEPERRLKRLKLKGKIKKEIPFELFDAGGKKICEVTSITGAKEDDVFDCLAYVEKEFFEEKIIETKIENFDNLLELKIKE